MSRNRSVAIVVRNGKLLMEQVFYFNRLFYTVPGGGIEPGETPEQAVLRELKEECGLDGTIVRPLAVQYGSDGHAEYSFYVEIPDDQSPTLGYDPEEEFAENPALRDVLWMALEEITEKDRAFLWGYGLINIEAFYEKAVAWGDKISYPGQ